MELKEFDWACPKGVTLAITGISLDDPTLAVADNLFPNPA
jgi:hypothetical protein